MEYFYAIVSYFSFLSPIVLTIGIILCFYYKFQTKEIKTVGLFFIFSLLIDFMSRMFGYKVGNNLFFINCYNTLELIFLYLIIKQNSQRVLSFVHVIFLIILGFNIYEFFSTEYLDHTQYQNYSNTVNSLFLLILSLTQMIQELKTDKIEFSKSIFVYLSIYLVFRTFLNLPINFIINYDDYLILVIWLINILNISSFYGYLLSYIWKNGRTHK